MAGEQPQRHGDAREARGEPHIPAPESKPGWVAHLEQATEDGPALTQLVIDALPAYISYVDSAHRYRLVNRRYEKWFGRARRDIVGRHVKDVVGEAAYDKMHPHILKALSGEQSCYENALTDKAGHTRFFEATYIPHVTDHGRIAGIFVLATDISARKRAEEELRRTQEELEHRVETRTAELRDVNTKLLEEIAIRKRFQEALQAREIEKQTIFDAVPAMIWYKDKDNRILRVNKQAAESLGRSVEEVEGQSTYDLYPNEAAQYHKDDLAVINTGKPRLGIIEPYTGKSREKRWVRTDKIPYRDDRGNILGVIVFAVDITDRKRTEEALEKSREQFRALAAHLESVREEERANIAREVHDELGQTLTALNMDLSWLKKRLAKSESLASARDKIAAMSGLIAETIESVRRLATELRPSVLDQLGLVAAIEWQTLEFQKRYDIGCRLLLPAGDVGLDQQRSTALFRMLQEALTNVARHANATQVTITLDKTDAEVRLTIEDNGKGISDDAQAAPHSFGILGMRERAFMLGGSLQIERKSGRGTIVSMQVPT